VSGNDLIPLEGNVCAISAGSPSTTESYTGRVGLEGKTTHGVRSSFFILQRLTALRSWVFETRPTVVTLLLESLPSCRKHVASKPSSSI